MFLQPTGFIFELVQAIIRINLLIKLHEDRTINLASRVKNALPFGSHVFQANVTIFELIQDIIETNLLTKFHEDWTINVASRVLTRKNAPPPGGHINLLSKFHEDRKINVASKPFKEKSPPPGGHFFQPTSSIFKPFQDIIWMNLLTKFHEDRTINVVSRVHDFQANVTIFKLIQDIIETNLLTKFHEDWTINVNKVLTRELSFFNRLFTCFHYIHIEKTAPHPGGHVFPPIMTIFELVRDIYKIDL
ncbi:hypothetical protein DPMN_071249 [Dreissena polymorpha]|uniref:Uncharacterized protein n=1 Tax=Dreissena polymorpha TaxID=45954 RepID=A0A9D3Z1Y4_DREPO|nr:hypothetical protein DPMN_071249 [Dreissena polymorpha]